MIKEEILKRFLLRKRLERINEKEKLYSRIVKYDEIEKFQISQFNRIWKKCIEDIPFYKMWKNKYNLPEKINSLSELGKFPVLTKKDIQKNQQLIFSGLEKYGVISTGGSSGEPTKFPISNLEYDLIYVNCYMGRKWWGFEPLDQTILIWGHSHLFGSGLMGRVRQIRRNIYDWLINIRRLNVYDMSIIKLKEYFKILKIKNPKFIIGYTSAIFKLAKYMKNNNLNLGRNSKLKGVIVTSESVIQYDIELMKEVFNVPVIIEYGMAETGVIAYSKGDSNNIKLFWDSFIGLRDSDGSLLITTITPKLFPLINYGTDDIIQTEDKFSILNIRAINGRKNDFIEIYNKNKKVEVHSEFFTHILKSIPKVVNFQLIQKRDLKIEIIYVALEEISIEGDFFKEVKREFYNIDEKQFSFHQVKEITGTIAGKSKWIVREK